MAEDGGSIEVDAPIAALNARARQERAAARREHEQRRKSMAPTPAGWDASATPGKKAPPSPRGRRRRKKAGASAAALPSPTDTLAQLVTPEARRHGIYAEDTVPGPTVVDAQGQETIALAKVVRNRGGTAVERWAARGDLDERQKEAVALYGRAHRLVFAEQRVVMNWSMVASFRGGAMSFEQFCDSVDKARRMLELIDNEVFFHLPLEHFHVWQNVVLFDEATGTAGARLGYSSKQAEAAAKVVVTTVSGMIANVMNLGRPRPVEEMSAQLKRDRDVDVALGRAQRRPVSEAIDAEIARHAGLDVSELWIAETALRDLMRENGVTEPPADYRGLAIIVQPGWRFGWILQAPAQEAA